MTDQSTRRRRALVVAVVAAAALAAPATATAHPARGQDPGWRAGQLVLLQTYGTQHEVSATSGNATIQLFNYQSRAQKWHVRGNIHLGSGDVAYQFANGYGRCLAPAGGSSASGVQVVAAPCTTNHHQFWAPVPAITDGPLPYFFYNAGDGLFLCVPDDHVGAPVRQYNTNHAPRTFVDIFGGRRDG